MPSTDKAGINSKGIDGSERLTDDCVFQHTNHYIPIEPNFSRSSDARLTDNIELKALIGACG